MITRVGRGSRMRLYVTGLAAAVALGLGLPGCVDPTELPFCYSASPNGDFPYQFPRIDAQEAAERAVEGAAIGAALGAGLGATIGINPGLGALLGTEIGAQLGAAIAVTTTHPLPDYKPIVVPASAVLPQYYDRSPP